MLNLILAIIVFISSFFPESKTELVGQQKGGQNFGHEEKIGIAREDPHAIKRSVTNPSTPKPIGYKTTAQTSPDNHGTFESAEALDQNGALIEEAVIDVETQTHVDTATKDKVTDESALKVSIGHAMVDVSTQTGDVAVFANRPPNASIPEMSPRTIGAVVAKSDPSQSLAPIDEIRTEVTLQTQEDTFADTSSSGVLASGSTIVNTPTAAFSPSTSEQEYDEEEIQPNGVPPKLASFSLETMALINRALNQNRFQRADEDHAVINGLEDSEQEESRSTDRLPEEQNPRHSVPVEESGNAYQAASEMIAAVEANPMVQQESLRIEKAAHQQTLEELVRLYEWCDLLEDENAGFHIQVENTQRENTRLQRQLHVAEDESSSLQTQLSDAEGQIHQLRSSSIVTIEDLHRQVVALDAEVSSYVQLGVNCYVRLQKIENLLNPFDRIFAEYQRLMIDAAKEFSTSVPHDTSTEPFDDERFVEVDEDDHNEEEEGGDNDYDDNGTPMLGIHEVTCDITEGGPGSAEDDSAALDDDDDDDDDFPCLGRPMRPGAAKRAPISNFAAISGDMHQKPSSSPFESPAQPAQQAPSPAAPVFPINFDFSEPSVKPEEKSETTAVQEPVQQSVQDSAYDTKASSTSRSRIYGKRGQGHPGRGRTRGRVPPRGGRGSSTIAGFGSPPAATAFSVNYNFSEASIKPEDKHEATTAPAFGPQAPVSSAVFSSPFTVGTDIFGAAPKVEQKQCPAQKAENAPKFGSDAFAKSPASASNSNAAFGGISFNTADDSQEPFNRFTPATEGATSTPSLNFNYGHPPRAMPPPQQNKNIFSMPTGHMEKDASAKAAQVKNNHDHGLVKISSSKGKFRPSSISKPATAPANLDVHRQSQSEEPVSSSSSAATEQAGNIAKAKGKSVFQLPGGDNSIVLGTCAVVAPSLAAHYTNTETGVREARTGKKKATDYQPDRPKRSTWAPFPPKETKNVPPVWMPVSPTIRPFEFKDKKGDSSKSQFLVLAQEEAHIAKVKSWIDAIAPRDNRNDTAKKLNTMHSSGTQTRRLTEAARNPPLTIEEGLLTLSKGIEHLSIEPSMDSTRKREKKIKVQLSGDWNVSGIANYTPNDLDKGPIFGRFLGGISDMGFGVTVKERQTADSEAGVAEESDDQSEVKPRETMGGQEGTDGQEHTGKQDQLESNSVRHQNVQNGGSNELGKTDSDAGSNDQNCESHQPSERNLAVPSDEQSSSQTGETYTSPYSLRGAFDFENTTPKKKFISPWSLKYRKE